MPNKYKGEITFDIYRTHKYRDKNNKKFFYYQKDLNNALLKNNMSTKGTKKELEKRLIGLYDKLLGFTSCDIKCLIKLQNRIKENIYKNKIKTQGIGIIDKSKCINQEDFYTLDNINDIEEKYFFSYEKGGKIFFFDIRSFRKLLKNTKINPYTQEEIPLYVIFSFKKRLEELKKNNISVKYQNLTNMTPEQKFNNCVLEIFQKIDMLNVAAGGIDMKWFTDLNIAQLKMLYKTMEDIWNYRANLTNELKQLIVPEHNVFMIPVYHICSYTPPDKRKLQYILLNEINKLISSSTDNIHRTTGSYYVLTALVEISPECASALPWLIQYN